VTTSRKDNSTAGGSSVNPGDENAYVIQWGPKGGDGVSVVYIWEIKHGGGAAEAKARAQVDNYVRYLQHNSARSSTYNPDTSSMSGGASTRRIRAS
jgi:hypothetical protein